MYWSYIGWKHKPHNVVSGANAVFPLLYGLMLLLLFVHDVKVVVVNDDISGIVGETESAEIAGLASIATENRTINYDIASKLDAKHSIFTLWHIHVAYFDLE